ncbi:hypothetical protein E4U52_006206 [Claviceps spartinae]|nr:hypothetical protein E4U52_006206 [Claviceps spartinae]
MDNAVDALFLEYEAHFNEAHVGDMRDMNGPESGNPPGEAVATLNRVGREVI